MDVKVEEPWKTEAGGGQETFLNCRCSRIAKTVIFSS